MKSKIPATSSGPIGAKTPKGRAMGSLAGHARHALRLGVPRRNKRRFPEVATARCPPRRIFQRLVLSPQRLALLPQWAPHLICPPFPQGDVLADDVMRSLVSTRDRELCRGRPEYRSFIEAYISEHVEESYGVLKATRAGKRCVTREAAHMAEIGEYDIQQTIYTGLRRRDPTFDPEAWGLPLELMDPEPRAESAASHGTSRTGAAVGDDPFPGLAFGLGGAADTPLDQIHLSPGMANFDQAGTSGARDP
nr:tubby-related protein 1-like isoform X1 [Ipomoea batatas]